MTEDNKPKSPSWVRVLLIGSLALNFVLAGLIGGVAFKVSKGGGPGGPVAQLGGPILAQFPPELRQTMRRELRLRRDEFKEIRTMVEKSDVAVQDALEAVPFDVEVFAAALDTRRDALGTAMNAINESIIKIVTDLTDEERALIAEAMEKRRENIKKVNRSE